MKGPLDGIRIVELGTMIAVPMATHMLAGQGADVTKVEDARLGDELRFFGSNKGGMSAWFISGNCGKRSLAIDLKTEEGKAILWKLLDGADALVEGFRPGVLERLGFGYDAVSERFPGIVYCSSSGFGPVGPYTDQPVYDPVIQSLSGLAASQNVDGRPYLVRSIIADKVSAVTNAQAITAALFQAARHGEGAHVQMNMMEANLGFFWGDLMMHCSLLDDDVQHQPNIMQSYRLHECKDGWVSIGVGTNDQWASFCTAFDRPDVLDDDRFKTAGDRANSMVAWRDAMDDVLRPYSRDDAVDRMRDVGVPVAPVLDPTEVFSDPQVQAAGLLQETDHPHAGRVRQPRPGAAAFGADVTVRPAPMHGEHTREILAELGYADGDVEALQAAGLIKQFDG